jgi:hypothetical protein
MFRVRSMFIAAASLLALAASAADFINDPAAGRFAHLPDGVAYPEGITVDPASGDVFVSTADFTFATGQPNRVLRFDKNGVLKAMRDIGAAPVLGLLFDQGSVYFTNASALTGGTSSIQRLPANFTASTPITTITNVPVIFGPANRTVNNADGSTDTIIFGSNGASLPNAMALRRSGGNATLYYSESFQGAIFAVANLDTCTKPCASTTVSHDSLLATAGHSVGVAANGIALNDTGTELFVNNLGDNRILRVNTATGVASVLTEDVARPDGMARDAQGNIWVCSATNNELVVVNPAGQVIAKLGAFKGVDTQGRVQGLLGPASLAFSGKKVLVTNFVIPVLGSYALAPTVTAFSIAVLDIPVALQ